MISKKSQQELETAFKAVSNFRKMIPQIEQFLYAATGKRMRVKMGTSGSATDGMTVTLTPPFELGYDLPHDRSLCDKVDARGYQRCPSCGIREELLVNIYHEAAHVIFGTFEGRSSDVNWARLRNHGYKRPAVAPGRSAYEAAFKVDPKLSYLLNFMEDIRVDRSMYKVRPGLERMGLVSDYAIMEGRRLDSKGNPLVWADRPLDMQAVAYVYLLGKYQNVPEGVFVDKIYTDLKDKKLDRLVSEIINVKSCVENMEHACLILKRLRELGYLHTDQTFTPPPPPEPEPKTESEPEPQTNEENDDQSGTADEPGESGESKGGVQSAGSSESDDADSGGFDSGDEASVRPDSDASPGGDDDPESDRPDDGDVRSDEGAGSDESGEGSDEEAPGERDDGRSSGNDGEPDRGDKGSPSSESDAEGSDDAESDGPGESSDEGDSQLPEGDGSELGGSDSKGTPGGDSRDPAEDRGPGGQSDSTGPSGDDTAGGSSPGGDQGDGATPAGSPEPGGIDGESGASDDGAQPSGDLDGDADDTVSDAEDQNDLLGRGAPDPDPGTGSPDPTPDAPAGQDGPPVGIAGTGDINVEPPPADWNEYEERHGTESDLQEATTAIIGHDQDLAHQTPSRHDGPIQVAIRQEEHFEEASTEIAGVIERHRSTYRPWSEMENGYLAQTHRERMEGNETIDPGLMTMARAKMRKAFEENKRSKYERNLTRGRVNTRSLGRRAPFGDDRLFQKRDIPAKRDYAAVIGVDVSGSTNGGNRLEDEKLAVMAQADLMASVGIKFAIVAHSGSSYYSYGVTSEYLEVQIVKDFDEPWSKPQREGLLDLFPRGANIDGHALEYLRRMVERRNETNKLVMYYSDGAMPAHNHKEELAILLRELEYCKKRNIGLAAVGIQSNDPQERYGIPMVLVREQSDILAVIDHVATAFHLG